MKIKRFADRMPQVVIKHIEEAGDVKIINLFETNSRTVVYYVENEKQVKAKKLIDQKEISYGKRNS